MVKLQVWWHFLKLGSQTTPESVDPELCPLWVSLFKKHCAIRILVTPLDKIVHSSWHCVVWQFSSWLTSCLVSTRPFLIYVVIFVGAEERLAKEDRGKAWRGLACDNIGARASDRRAWTSLASHCQHFHSDRGTALSQLRRPDWASCPNSGDWALGRQPLLLPPLLAISSTGRF